VLFSDFINLMPQEKQKKVPAIWKVIAKLVPAEKTPRTLLEGNDVDIHLFIYMICASHSTQTYYP
jgi:hypothetical protein